MRDGPAPRDFPDTASGRGAFALFYPAVRRTADGDYSHSDEIETAA